LALHRACGHRSAAVGRPPLRPPRRSSRFHRDDRAGTARAV